MFLHCTPLVAGASMGFGFNRSSWDICLKDESLATLNYSETATNSVSCRNTVLCYAIDDEMNAPD
jgi:hypothetical protein